MSRLGKVAWLCAVLFALMSSGAAQDNPRRMLLIPLDDRPAAGHFAEMIAAMADVQLDRPPTDYMGRFTQPGMPEMILHWMETEDLSQYEAVIVSTDMIAYGGLIASRTDRSSYNLAIKRLRRLWAIIKENPDTRFLAFSALMRLAPTATLESLPYKNQLARYAAIKAQYRITAEPEDLKRLQRLKYHIPHEEIHRYEAVRDRNHRVQQELVRMVAYGAFEYLIVGQDDAQPMGPHLAETQRLMEMTENLSIRDRVYFCEGIDQHSNVLVSRALLTDADWSPRVRIVFADELGRQKTTYYEAQTVETSLRDQLYASGARPMDANGNFDYTLYVNTPYPRDEKFQQFVHNLQTEIDQSFPVAVADINLGKTGTGDLRLFDALIEQDRAVKLLSYAGWNTAGNTMGTAIPAANVYLLARRLQVDALDREVARRKFLLHRLINDFEFHKYVRPEAYALLKRLPNADKTETYGASFQVLDQAVREEMALRLQRRFEDQLAGSRFFAGPHEYELTGIRDIQVYLPWPRAYEVALDFQVEVSPVEALPTGATTSIFPED